MGQNKNKEAPLLVAEYTRAEAELLFAMVEYSILEGPPNVKEEFKPLFRATIRKVAHTAGIPTEVYAPLLPT